MEKVLIALAKILADKKVRDKVLLLIGSIVVGFLLLLATPIIALYTIGNVEIEPPEIDRNAFNESAFIEQLSPEQQERMSEIQSAGDAIEAELTALGVSDQTIKAQLIYMSYFDEVEGFDANFYAHLFYSAPNDTILIDSINQNYSLSIDYNEYMRTYVFVMNSTINEYMFTDASTKNELANISKTPFLIASAYAFFSSNCILVPS